MDCGCRYSPVHGCLCEGNGPDVEEESPELYQGDYQLFGRKRNFGFKNKSPAMWGVLCWDAVQQQEEQEELQEAATKEADMERVKELLADQFLKVKQHLKKKRAKKREKMKEFIKFQKRNGIIPDSSDDDSSDDESEEEEERSEYNTRASLRNVEEEANVIRAGGHSRYDGSEDVTTGVSASIQELKDNREHRRMMMKSIQEKWERKRRSEINPHENTRHQPDSFVSFQLNRPPFHAFGNGNSHPVTCKQFLLSHNAAPQSYPNKPQTPQVYNTVIGNMARRSIERKNQLAKQLKLEKKKLLREQKRREKKQMRKDKQRQLQANSKRMSTSHKRHSKSAGAGGDADADADAGGDPGGEEALILQSNLPAEMKKVLIGKLRQGSKGGRGSHGRRKSSLRGARKSSATSPSHAHAHAHAHDEADASDSSVSERYAPVTHAHARQHAVSSASPRNSINGSAADTAVPRASEEEQGVQEEQRPGVVPGQFAKLAWQAFQDDKTKKQVKKDEEARRRLALALADKEAEEEKVRDLKKNYPHKLAYELDIDTPRYYSYLSQSKRPYALDYALDE